MSTLRTANTMLSTAETECSIAMWILPPAVMIKYQFTLSKGQPENLDKAGLKWRQVSQKLQETSGRLQEAISNVPPDAWTGDDRKAYEQKVKEVCEQLEIAATYYMAVGVALTAFAYALFTYAVFALAMGTFIGALAAACAAAMAGVVTSVSVPAFESAAATCLTITWAATGILAAAANMAAMVFQGGAALTALLEYQHGNKEALNDFVTAEKVGAVAAVANLAQNAANAGLAYANRTGGDKLPWMKSDPKGSPISSVDFDADRDKNKDYQLGVGAEGGKGGGQVRATVGDHGLEGIEASGHVKSGDHDIGFKGGYKDSDGVFGGKGGTISGEVSDTVSSDDGSKNKFSVGGSYDTHAHAGTGELGYTHTGKDGTEDGVKLSGGYDATTHQATGGATYTHTGADGTVNKVGLDGGYNTASHQASGGVSYTHEGSSGAQHTGRVEGGYNTASHQASGGVSYSHDGLTGAQHTGRLDGTYNTASDAWSGEGSYTRNGSVEGRAGHDSRGNSFYADGTVDD